MGTVAAVGTVAALSFAMLEDFALVFAGFLALGLQLKDGGEEVEEKGVSGGD